MSATNSEHPRILIVGCGGIGGVLGCHLLSSNADVFIATTNERVREVWQKSGPYLNGRRIGGPLPGRKILEKPSDGAQLFDLVFVAVQPNQIANVAQDLDPHLHDGSQVVCLSNGLCETRLAEFLGREKIVGAVVAWGARMPRPGHYLRTSKGGFLVGKLDRSRDHQMDEILRLLRLVGPVTETTNLSGARFSKLTINCAVSALGTIGGKTLGELLRREDARSLGIALMREAVAVAGAEGIRLEPVINVDVGRLVSRDPKKLIGKAAQHALLMAVGARYRKLRSSMLASIEKGRPPAVDFINGEISALGRKNNIPTPFNDAACSVIWGIARGELSTGEKTLAELRLRAEEEDRGRC